MTIIQEELLALGPDKLSKVYDEITLVGIVLGRLALLEVVLDPTAGSTAKAQAAKTLTQIGESPQIISERLKASQFADKSPTELRELIGKLRTGEMKIEELVPEEED
jgi:hypothetical protein